MSDSNPPSQLPPYAREVVKVSLEERMKSAYLDYAMSVIVGRALPDVRDGLKPVHRRILYAMYEAGNEWNKPFKKSARIVGDVLGKYHPHGQDAVYDSLVRMAQEFSMRAPLVDGQGNFGSVDGDNPAAMRYTEVRMARISGLLLDDLDKESVDFTPNYDGASKEPTVLPARFPNLLINGVAGIAVGMATNIPPHNLGETIDACLLLLKKPNASLEELIALVPAPDFPTGGIIYGVEGVRHAYGSGRGRVVMRAKTHFEDLDKRGTRQAIIVDEIPYQVNKASLITRIAELARDKKINGISDLRDESDRQGIRVVIEVRRGDNAEVILNNLYKETQLQESFSVNMVALTNGEPKQLNLAQLLLLFLDHRRDVVVRRAIFELRRAQARAHLLEGFAVVVANVDAIIELIKTAPSPADAEQQLLAKAWPAETIVDMQKRIESPEIVRPESETEGGLVIGSGNKSKKAEYHFSRTQAKAILEMRLARLTAMEREKIVRDYQDIVAQIVGLVDLLASPNKIRKVIADELTEAKKQFATPRKSEIVVNAEEIDMEQLIAREEMVVTFSHTGYVKRQALTDYRTQRRGGRGRQAATAREGDFINQLFVANTHDYLLIFTNRGRLYWKKVYDLPLASYIGRGRPIAGLLELGDNEKVQTVLAVSEFCEDSYVVMATAKGTIKKTSLKAFSRPRKGGLAAINLDVGDRLINVARTDGDYSILLLASSGKAVRFDEQKLRAMGRLARGVRGMRIDPERDNIVTMLAVPKAEEKQLAILIATEHGLGKRTAIDAFAIKGRATKGMIALKLTAKTGAVIGACLASEDDELMLITNGGVLVRTSMQSIRRMGRATQGVRLIRLDEGSQLISIARIADAGKDEEEQLEAADDEQSAAPPSLQSEEATVPTEPEESTEPTQAKAPAKESTKPPEPKESNASKAAKKPKGKAGTPTLAGLGSPAKPDDSND